MPIPHSRRARRCDRVIRKAVESLETRTMLAVSLDANGWTRVTPSDDSKIVYVSSSQGSDSNSGLSESSPVKSIAKGVSLLRNGHPDHLLLKRGDVFKESIPTWSKSGRNAEEPMLISSYGSSSERPWLKTGTGKGFYSHTAFHDVAIIGLKFEANTRNPDSPDFTGTSGAYGLQVVGPVNGLLVEDSSFDHYVYNVSVQGFSDYAKNVKFRRSQIVDSYQVGASGVGFYASMTQGMLLEENLFDHNGWNEQVAPSGSSHNVYLWESNRNPVIRGNIFANGGQHGLQARGGGTIENNLFIRNPIHLLVGNGSTVTPGGVVGKVSGNVFLDARGINGSGRGWAIELGNIKQGGGSYVRDNIIAHDTHDNSAAIKLQTATGAANAAQGVGINDLTIEDNIIYKWHQGLSIVSGFDVGGSGQTGLNDIVVRENDFQDILIQKIINHNPSYDGSEEDWSNNSYHSDASSSGWFSVAGKTTSFDTWKDKYEPTAKKEQIDYPDPGRDIAKYNASLGGAASRDAFLKNVREQSESNWKKVHTAAAAISWIRAGFTGATPSELPPEPVPAPEPEPTPSPQPEPTPQPTPAPEPEPTAPSGAPTAALDVHDRTLAGASPHHIKVTYTDDNQVKVSSFGNGDIRVTGPNGYAQAATFVSADDMTNGTPRTATYVIAAPGGAWDSDDNGTYTVHLNNPGVRDVAGLYAAAQILGTFDADIPAAPAPEPTPEPTPAPTPEPQPTPSDPTAPDAISPTVLWSNFDPNDQTITVRFSEDVASSINISDLRLKNTATSELIPYATMRMTYDQSTFTATWSFSEPIPVADYKVMLGGGLVTDASGNKLDGNGDGKSGDDHFIRITAAEMSAAAALEALSSLDDPMAPQA